MEKYFKFLDSFINTTPLFRFFLLFACSNVKVGVPIDGKTLQLASIGFGNVLERYLLWNHCLTKELPLRFGHQSSQSRI